MAISPNFEYDFEAEITFEQGTKHSRTGPVRGNYRPQLHYQGADSDWIIHIDWVDATEVFPGDTALAQCRLLSPWFHKDYIVAGCQFEVREGQRVVAKAVVTRLLKLHEHANQQQREAKERGDILEQGPEGFPAS